MNKPKSLNKFHDLTAPPDLRKSDGTGPISHRRPVYEDYRPPCNQKCPAGENIQGWLDKVYKKEFQEAWQLLIEDNPMPAIHGRVCYHPCETSCNRENVDNAVSIHQVERHLGDLAIEHNWKPRIKNRKSNKKV
jgi:NADPH-dependent glutamate synthase beta subunit-like oxidoreductase